MKPPTSVLVAFSIFLTLRLPREVVGSPSQEILKARLGRTLSCLTWWKMSLPMAEGGWMAFKGPFQPKAFHDSMILHCICSVRFDSLINIGKDKLQKSLGENEGGLN